MLKDKVVVVTGGAGLLGRAFVSAISGQNGIVVVADLNAEAAIGVADAFAVSHPGRVEAVPVNIADKASLTALIAEIRKRHGRIDAVINNAYPRNKNYGHKLEDVTYEDFCENLNLHLGGYFLVAQQFGLFFRTQGRGNIVNMASIYGTMTPRFEVYADTAMTMPVEYAAIKAGVIQLTRYFAKYFSGDGIRVNSLSPGGILDRQPEAFLQKYKAHCNAKGMLNPSDIAGTLLFLLSDASKYITGQNFIVDDGFSL